MLFYADIISENSNIQLETLKFVIEAIGNHGKVKVIHKIVNKSKKSDLLSISITLDDETSITGYSYVNQNGEFISQLKEKQETKIEQRDAVTNGYSAEFMEQQDDTTFTLSLGLMRNQSEITFTIEYLTRFDVDEDNLVLKIPKTLQLENEKEIPFEIEMKGNYDFKYEGKITEEEEINVQLNKEMMTINKDEKTNETIISSTFVNKENKGDVKVIFLCDRSGSMKGKGIESLKEMLQLFLRQLPMNSQFQIISFGTDFKFMFDKMVHYNDEILKKATDEVKEFDSSFGGTRMFSPLEKLIEKKTHLCHIILLTDGEVAQKQKTLDLIQELAKKNTIHGVGLGRECDVDLIRKAGRIGNGISVNAKDMSKLRKEVSKITQRILIPSINNCEIKWNIKGKYTPEIVNNFNGIVTSYIKCEDELKDGDEIICELTGKCEGEKKTFVNKINYEDKKGILLHEIVAFNEIRKLECENKTKEATEIALKYNILSKNTGFVAIEKENNNEIDFIKNVKITEPKNSQRELSKSMNNKKEEPKKEEKKEQQPEKHQEVKEEQQPKKEEEVKEVKKENTLKEEQPKEEKQKEEKSEEKNDVDNNKKIEEIPMKNGETEDWNRFLLLIIMLLSVLIGVIIAIKCPTIFISLVLIGATAFHILQNNPTPKEKESSIKPEEEEIKISEPIPIQPVETKIVELKKEEKVEEHEEEKKELNKKDIFDNLVLCQKANGEFNGVEEYIKEVSQFYGKGIENNIIQTFFVVLVLFEHFKEYKTEYKLLIKKSYQWLATQTMPPSELENEMKEVIKTIHF